MGEEKEEEDAAVDHPPLSNVDTSGTNDLFVGDSKPDLNPFRSNSSEDAPVVKAATEKTTSSRTYQEDGKKIKETMTTESNGKVKTITVEKEITDQDGNVSSSTHTTTEKVEATPAAAPVEQ